MNRINEFMEKSIMYISSDLYPGGKFIPQKDGRLSPWDRGFRQGLTIYDAGRAFHGTPWQLKRIIARFMRTLKASHLDINITPKELETVCREVCARNKFLLRKNEGEDFSYSIDMTPGEYGDYGKPLPAPKGTGNPTIIVRNSFIDMKSYAKRFSKGLHLVTPSTRVPPPEVIDSKIKTHSRHYQASGLYETRLVDPEGCPLFLDIHGNLAETHVTNVFLVYKRVLMTPSTRNILEGNGRANVLKVARDLKISVIERDLQPFHLYNADEAFVSGEARFLSPVSSYNGVTIGEETLGPISAKLLKAFIKEVNYDITGISNLSEEVRTMLGITFEPFSSTNT